MSGTLAGVTEQAVLSELQSRRLAPIRVRAVREAARRRTRVSTRQLATAYRQLGDLLRAGVPLLRALRLLGRSKSAPKLAAVMRQIADDVADGGPLADAMSAHEDVFPSVQVAMIRAAERGGFLEQVLHRLGTFIEHQAELRGKVLGNLLYPAVLVLVATAVAVFGLVFLIPQFRGFYEKIELGLSTKILLTASRLCTDHWRGVLVALALAACIAWWLRRQAAFRRWLSGAALRVPGLGTIIRDGAVGRFARVLGTLLENGIPLLPAMQISKDATGHVVLGEAIDAAIESVRTGETLADPLARSGMFSEDAIEIIAVGESANNLPEVLLTLAETIERRVDRLTTTFVRLMEPALLLLLGAMVFYLFLALVVPMLKMSSSF